MKNFIILFFLFSLALTLSSQNKVYKKYAEAEELSLPYTDDIEFKSAANIRITEADWLSFGFNALEEFDSDFEYSIYGTCVINNHKVLLVKRTYREENNHWAIYISDDGRIFSHINIAYENSEGVLHISSEINNDRIKVKETNHFEETPTEKEKHYILTDTGFKEK